jgi:hypothetical protein
MGDEAYLFAKTRDPIMIGFFSRFCRLGRYRLFSPLNRRVPPDVGGLVAGRFGTEGLVQRGALGRSANMMPIATRSTQASKILSRLDLAAGDECVLVGRSFGLGGPARRLLRGPGLGAPKAPRTHALASVAASAARL